MRTSRLACAVALLLFVVPVVAAAAETEQFHRVVPLADGGTLDLRNFSGHVRITGADVTSVTIDAVRRATRDRLDHIKLDVQSTGSTVIVEANKKDEGWDGHKDNVVETEFEIQVPRHTKLKVNVFSSDVRIRNVAAEQDVHTFSGEVSVEDVAARVQAKTFSGGVTVSAAAGAAGPAMEIETFSGGIAVRVPEGARASVAFDSFSGKLTCDWPLTLQEQKRGKLRAQLNGGDAQHPLTLKTFSGDVKIVK